ncbi:MAG: flagellin [Phycisphaerae bacterium]|nr:flagellin [Phycisphaerae bacterium]
MITINTNTSSLVASRILTNNTQLMNRTLERLSTGYRINRGADDPAGLIASETLRFEKEAINASIENAGRADNVISVAEGALQEVSTLLVSLEDLVDRSANQSGLSAAELQANQLQIDAILQSVDRIATTTTFAGNKLLDGSMAYTTSGVASANLANVQVNSSRAAPGATRSVEVAVTASAQKATLTHTTAAGTLAGAVTISIGGNKGVDTFSFASGTAVSSVAAAVNLSTNLTGVTATVTSSTILTLQSSKYGSSEFVSVEALSGTFTVTGGTSPTKDTGVDISATVNGVTADTSGLEASVRTGSLDLDLIVTSGYGNGTIALNTTTTFSITGGGATFQITPDLSLAGQVAVGLQNTTTTGLGDSVTGFLSTLKSGGTNAMSTQNFTTAQEIVRLAGEQVASLRGRLGAIQQNTLAPTINSLKVAFENVSAAESAIRDADFAEETSNLTRAQILVQSSTASLQLANRAPQNVLALLG